MPTSSSTAFISVSTYLTVHELRIFGRIVQLAMLVFCLSRALSGTAMKIAPLLAGATLLAAACGGPTTSPTERSQPAARAAISIASISVTAQTQSSGGYAYRIRLQLRETGGVAATISSVDLTFLNGSSQVATAQFDRPISDASNQVPANGSVDSRELLASDDNASHPGATTVQVKVAFVDSSSNAGAVTGSSDV